MKKKFVDQSDGSIITVKGLKGAYAIVLSVDESGVGLSEALLDSHQAHQMGKLLIEMAKRKEEGEGK